jgi:hypothetical protein
VARLRHIWTRDAFDALFVSAGICAVVLVGAPASAEQQPATSLTVHRTDAAQSCPDERGLIAAIDGVGSPQPGRAQDAPLSLDVSLDVDEHGHFRATIEASGRKSGRRVLTGRGNECGPLVDALAVTLALLMDREISQPAPKADASVATEAGDDEPGPATSDEHQSTEATDGEKDKQAAPDKDHDEAPGDKPELVRDELSGPRHATLATPQVTSQQTGLRAGAWATVGLPDSSMSWMPSLRLVHTRGAGR